jgi:hypothetical protein
MLTEAFHFSQSFPASVRIEHMAPYDIFLFVNLKNTFEGKIFVDMQTVAHNEVEQLLPISKRCFLHWQEQWN